VAERRAPGRPRTDGLRLEPIVGYAILEEHPSGADRRRKGSGYSLVRADHAKELVADARRRGQKVVEIRSDRPVHEAMEDFRQQTWIEWVRKWRRRNRGTARFRRAHAKKTGKPLRLRVRCGDCEGIGHWENRTRYVLNSELGRIEAWTWKTVLIELDRRIRQRRGESVADSIPDPEPPTKKARSKTPGRWFVCRTCGGTGVQVRESPYSFDSALGPLLETTAGAAAEAAARGWKSYQSLPLGANYKAMALELHYRAKASELRARAKAAEVPSP